MDRFLRNAFPYLAVGACLAAVAWAVSFGTLPPADFAFANGDEPHTLDPHKATGALEERILTGLFEGLMRNMPVGEPRPNGTVDFRPVPAVAADYPEISEDGRVYTFKIRPSAKWSNGRPITADDFVWSWRRCLHPDTASKYVYQLYYIQGASRYNLGETESGDRVEVELYDRRDPLQPFPRGTMLRGVMTGLIKPPEPKPGDDEEENERQRSDWRKKWTWVVDIKPPDSTGEVDWNAEGTTRAFSADPESAAPVDGVEIERCHHVLIDFKSSVGAHAPDDRTFVVTLVNRTPFFNELAAFYTLFPVNPECVEQHGTPDWTKPQNIVTNGPYELEFRRVRDRVRIRKSAQYWNAAAVKLDRIDCMAVNSNTTALNMYMNGQVDWITDLPKTMIPELIDREDFVSAPAMITYFYRLNVTRKPLDNVLVRRALNMAIDKDQICRRVTKAGELPARSLVPPGMTGYQAAYCGEFNPEEARKLLTEAGYPNGRGLPTIEILYNSNDNHRDIAQVIAQHWSEHLGIDVELRNVAWGVYLDLQRELDFTVARAGWIGDYPDPNTFLDMFVTDGPQNQTGWSNEAYDQRIRDAASQSDPATRLQLLREAEEILMTEMPLVPIYFYVSINMVSPRVDGFSANILDKHPLHILDVGR